MSVLPIPVANLSASTETLYLGLRWGSVKRSDRYGQAGVDSVHVVVMITRIRLCAIGLAFFGASVACSTSSKPEVIKAFSPGSDKPLTASGVVADQGGWRIDAAAPGSVRLFEVPGETCDGCRLIYRAKVKADHLAGAGYLEMWVRAPGKGEFFSKGLDQKLSGTTDWTSQEIPFMFQKGERADLVKINVAFEGSGGSLWIKDIELLKASLP